MLSGLSDNRPAEAELDTSGFGALRPGDRHGGEAFAIGDRQQLGQSQNRTATAAVAIFDGLGCGGRRARLPGRGGRRLGRLAGALPRTGQRPTVRPQSWAEAESGNATTIDGEPIHRSSSARPDEPEKMHG
jgi:hypothetical protein